MSEAPRPRLAALAVAVGLVLADSSIVVLALPQIYRELDTSVAGVTWVLVSFNLVMALAAVPAALLARRAGPGRAAAVGLAVFAGASVACGISAELSTLIAARCVQALGGAAGGDGRAGAASRHGRLRAPGDSGLGHRRRHRRGARTGRRRPAHRARLLAVDLPRPGAGGAGRRGADPRRRQARGGDGRARGRAAPDRSPPPARQPGAGDGLGGDRRRPLPARPAADRGLAPDPDRRRDRRQRRCRWRRSLGSRLGRLVPERQGARGGRGDPRLRRARRRWRCCPRPRWR